jgi:hypothetical protein
MLNSRLTRWSRWVDAKDVHKRRFKQNTILAGVIDLKPEIPDFTDKRSPIEQLNVLHRPPELPALTGHL